MDKRYSLGLDFGTNSVRALLVDLTEGREVSGFVWNYRRGKDGIITSAEEPHLARQDPLDYIEGTEAAVKEAVSQARINDPDFTAEQVVGIGIDTTGSTPIPVDAAGVPISFKPEFKDNPAALAWLWKDHTSAAEAEEITELARKTHPEYLRRCGGRYSSEWFFAKILHLARSAPDVYAAAASFVEFADFVPAFLCRNSDPRGLKRSICAAGHKALFADRWNGLPSEEFLSGLDPAFQGLRGRLYDKAYPAGEKAGGLCAEWARRLGLREGVAVSVGAFDAHLGAVGAGIRENGLVKVIGTSTCDLMVFPAEHEARLEKIDGMCGLAEGSIIPGLIGLEAGQSAVGDIFAWFAENLVSPEYHRLAEGRKISLQGYLTERASALKPGESGLLALDWNNGNRSILVDQQLTGLVLGQTLATRPEEIYLALIEATGFGARMIIDQIEQSGEAIKSIIACGGISKKNPLLMQVYSDIFGKPIRVSLSEQTCALGAAIAGAVAAGNTDGGFENFGRAQERLCGFESQEYRPRKDASAVYENIYRFYRQLHDTFGRPSGNLYPVMKELLKLQARA